ncbi:MAG: Na+/H+ antiporter subunit E [Dethiobacter sp.]|jgi:multicomponent Na+:H+ antiporter subunit E|nr:Na+/H+ antiporter subunit E [Dethiobacter sp.]
MNKSKYGITFWGTACILFLFWLLITWRLHWQHLLVGALCAIGVAMFNRDILLLKSERPLYLRTTIIKWVVYLYHLIVAIFKSNWDVAKIVLRRDMGISPCFVKFSTKINKPLYRVILGNSITLTPGTLTVELEEDFYIVHCITRANAEDVADWDMTRRLVEIEEVESGAA